MTDDYLNWGEVYCSYPPTKEDWINNRNIFSGFGNKYYNLKCKKILPNKFYALERELERCFCSDCFLSCVILARAIFEIFFNIVKDVKLKDQWLSKLIADDYEWLKDRRESIFHSQTSMDSVKMLDLISLRDELRADAHRSCAMVYHFARAYIQLMNDKKVGQYK